MVIVVVNEGLEVADLDLLLAALAFEQRVQLEHHSIPCRNNAAARLSVKVCCMALEELLNDLIGLKLIVCDPQYLEGLLAGHKAALDPQALLGDLLSALVAELFHGGLCALLM